MMYKNLTLGIILKHNHLMTFRMLLPTIIIESITTTTDNERHDEENHVMSQPVIYFAHNNL